MPRHYGVRTDRFKLIHYPTTDEWELFDLLEEPHELQSVYASAEHASVRQEMGRNW